MPAAPNVNLFEVRLQTERLDLRLPRVSDATDLAAFVTRNRERHARWDPRRGDEYFTSDWWKSQLEELEAEVAAGRMAPFIGLLRGGGELVLRANLSNIVRGAFQAAYLGFSVDSAHEGKGLAFEGVDAVVCFAFERWNLHRVMANHRPGNARSAALLTRLGFEREGYARDYLHIDGAWRDHVLTQRTNQDWR